MSSLSIPVRLTSLVTVLMCVLVGSNLFLKQRLSQSAGALTEDTRLIDNLETAVHASQAFGDLKYWLLELAVDPRPRSEDNARISRDRLTAELDRLEEFEPETVAVLRLETDALMDSTLIAIEAYNEGNATQGDAFLAKGLEHVRVVDQRLDGMVRVMEVEVADGRNVALANSREAVQVSWAIIFAGLALGTLLTVVVLRSIYIPLRQLLQSIRDISRGELDTELPRTGPDEIGAMSRTLEMYRDSLTERDRLAAEHESTTLSLNRTRTQLESALESISEAFSLYDRDDRLVLSNSRYREMISPGLGHLIRFGMTFEEVVRIVAENGMVPDAVGRVDEWIAERVAMHRNPSGPKVQKRADGRWLQINERRTENGSIVAVYEDVTELKQREEELAAANREKEAVVAELQEVLDAIDYGVLLMDSDLNVRLGNRAYRKIWNMPEDFHKPGEQKTLLDYYTHARSLYPVPDEEWEDLLEKRLQAIREGRTDPPENRLADGKILKRDCVCLSDGGRMLTYFDITELKRVQDDLRIAKEEAESATRAKSQFLANMSHELRTPLNAVIGITELLKEEAEQDDKSDLIEPLQRVASAGRHLLSLIDNILDLSKIEAHRLEIQVEEFDVSQMVEDVATTVEPLALIHSNRLSVDCDDRVGRMRSDATKIRQIMINILGNACKFTEAGEVGLKVYRAPGNGEDWLTMEFTDTGIGIDESKIDTLFKEFAQGDSSATRRYGGTGLGLVISQRLCTILGGDIDVSSQPGVGTRFVVRLPLALTR